MDMKTIEKIAATHGWYVNGKTAAEIIGVSTDRIFGHLREWSVPSYLVGRTKMYFLPEMFAAIEKQRWKEPPYKRGPKPMYGE
jgi:hypothetical protein